MLEGLDEIDWALLEHAYGAADDVPDQLRALAFGDEEERQSAMWSLYGNIYHQGTVYNATAYAVPFLAEMLEAPRVTNKAEILHLLSHLASGHSYLDAHQDFSWEQERAANDPEGYRAQMQAELGWVKAARDAVYRYHPQYLAMLGDADPAIRATAAYLLSVFREQYDTLLPPLQERLTAEQETEVESALLLCLGYLAPYDDGKTIAHVEPYLAPDFPLLTRWAAAMTVARLRTTNSPEPVLALLVKVLQSGETTAALNEQMAVIPWWSGSVLSVTCSILGFMDKAKIAPFLPQIFDALPDIHWTHMEGVVYALLHLVFDGKVMPEGTTAAMLDDLQRRTLSAIADHALQFPMEDGRISQNGNVGSLLRSFQIPASPHQLRSFLAGA